MAEKKELRLSQKITRGALIGAIALLGLNGMLALGVPALFIERVLNISLLGGLYGGAIAALFGLGKEAAKTLTPQPVKK